MESTEWIETTLGVKLTPFQARCIEMLGWIAGGIHNAPIDWKRKGVTWAYGVSGFSVVWKHDHMATWDTSKLTWLVMGCCEARIRLEISVANLSSLRLSFWQRQAEGKMSQRHPSLDEFVAAFRNDIPSDHPILYRNHPEHLLTCPQCHGEADDTERPCGYCDGRGKVTVTQAQDYRPTTPQELL